MRHYIKQIRNTVSKKPRIYIAGLVLVFVVSVALAQGGGGNNEISEDTLPQVELLSLEGDVAGASLYTTSGTVESSEEAVLRSESSGIVVRVPVSLGDSVVRGQVIAQLENSSERAAFIQAEGSYEASLASLERLQGTATGSGTSESSVRRADSSLEAAVRSALNTYISALASVEDAILAKTDPIFHDPDGDPDLLFNLSMIVHGDAQNEAEHGRKDMQELLSEWRTKANTLESFDENVEEYLVEAISWTAEVQDFLGKAFLAVNASSREDLDIETWKSNIAAARSSVDATRSSLISARNTYVGALSSQEVETIGKEVDIRSAEAQVKQAQGRLLQAQSALEKTIVRSPVSGSILELNVSDGTFVSSFEEIGVVANTGGKEVVAYLPVNVASRLSQGTEVEFEGGTGVVSALSQGLNRSTQQIEVRVALDPNANVVIGERISLDFSLDETGTFESDVVRIPLSAVKIDGDIYSVFVVNEDGELEARAVNVQGVEGSFLVVDKVDFPNRVVSDVRGLREGDKVRVEN